MAYPKQSELELPLLSVIARLGGDTKPKDTYAKVAEFFPQLTEDDLKRKMESSPSIYTWHNKVQWVRQVLINKGQLDGSVRGILKITEEGRARLDSSSSTPESVNRTPQHHMKHLAMVRVA